MFKRKCEQSKTIEENAIVIEDGDEMIRNGRKLYKEDFSYFFKGLEDKRDYSLENKDSITNR